MQDDDQIIRFIRSKGPILPVQLAGELKKDMIIAGAVLSNLAGSRKVLISNTKVGGSPVYYLPDQAYRLQDLYKYLNEKDKRAYDLLKQRRVLRDITLTPLLRVSLRNIKDFAKPVEVTVGRTKEIFWRWYMTSPQDAETIIKSFFKEQEKEKPAERPKEKEMPGPAEHPVPAEQPKPQALPVPISEPAPVKHVPKEQEEFIRQKEDQQRLKVPEEPKNDSLHVKTKKFFNNKHIIIRNIEVIRKNSEIDYIIDVPSTVGNINYYCKAKSKKKVGDSDLASAFVKGQLKKLPVLFLTVGDLTKKAKEMLDEEFQNLKVKKI